VRTVQVCLVGFAVVFLTFASSARAGTTGFGVIERDNSNGTIWGSRVDIGAPSQFNILSNNLALMRVALEIYAGNQADDGIEQVGFEQANSATFDQGCTTGDPGQLKTFYEFKHSGYHGTTSFYNLGYHCGIIANISGGDRTFHVHGYIAGSNYCWRELVGGTTQNQDCSFSGDGVGCNCGSANLAYIGGEIGDDTDCNSNTTITGDYGTPTGSIVWQRTANQFLTSITWNGITTPSGHINTASQWSLDLGDVPSPFISFTTC
jgi:hypothetical protein